MKTDAQEDPNINKEYLKELYQKKRNELAEKIRARQGNLSEDVFQSIVSIAAADSFKELQKQGIDEKTTLNK